MICESLTLHKLKHIRYPILLLPVDLMYIFLLSLTGLQDPDARDQSLISLFHSLPLSYYKTAVYLLEHLKT